MFSITEIYSDQRGLFSGALGSYSGNGGSTCVMVSIPFAFALFKAVVALCSMDSGVSLIALVVRPVENVICNFGATAFQSTSATRF